MEHAQATNDEPSVGVIVLDAVAKRFGSFVAVHHADFAIGRGEFFSMLGPSGCGKTTTLRMIAGFEAPSSGRILLDDEDVSRTPPYKRNVNTVFQQYALFPHMSVADNVAFGLRSRRTPGAEVSRRVGEILDIVHMAPFSKRKPAQLSGGQQQRVALARALVNRPSALLLDEPLAALDLKLRQAMQLELKRIQRETGVTFVFVTHDQQEALTMSDRIAVMSEGLVDQIGTPSEIYDRPATSFVAGFIGEANLLAATVASVNGSGSSVHCAGTVVHTADATTRPGLATVLMVRPERIAVQAGPPSAPSTGLEVVVTEMVFRGPTVHVGMEQVNERTPLVAHVPAATVDPAVRPGERLWASWERDAGYLVPSPGASMTSTVAEPTGAPA